MNKIITIEGENTNYLISDDGRLFNKKTNKFLKGSINSTGYRVYQLTVNGKYYNFLCHRLVAEYFLPNQENYPVVHHIDGNKLNNKVENLKWVSFSDNLQESYLMGRRNTKNQSYITENELNKYKDKFGDIQFYMFSNFLLKCYSALEIGLQRIARHVRKRPKKKNPHNNARVLQN